jgi:hypothetical protein
MRILFLYHLCAEVIHAWREARKSFRMRYYTPKCTTASDVESLTFDAFHAECSVGIDLFGDPKDLRALLTPSVQVRRRVFLLDQLPEAHQYCGCTTIIKHISLFEDTHSM